MFERWAPSRDLRRFDRMFSRIRREPAVRDGTACSASPLDVVQEDDSIVVRASLPGIYPKDIDVTIEDGVLAIKGETNSETEESTELYLLRERRAGRFDRQLKLPDYVDAESAEPTYENGVVTITFPRLKTKKAKRLEIKAA